MAGTTSWCKNSSSCSLRAAESTSASPRQTPCLVCALRPGSSPSRRMGKISGNTRSPSFLTSSPKHFPAVCRRSSDSALSPAMSLFMRRGRMRRRVRGVFATTVFQMCTAALRTAMTGSERSAYTAESKSWCLASPSAAVSAAPCASVEMPSSSSPPSTRTFPEVPAMRNIMLPRSSAALTRMRQFSLASASSMDGKSRSRLGPLCENSSTNTRPAPSAA
mmetsp:Transcript_14068/g.59280  ORF Transcript_14068/g.59280 Transcript_14068/m.59280 type:complete len:220 (-) Transcript_14068:2076-2735(-)